MPGTPGEPAEKDANKHDKEADPADALDGGTGDGVFDCFLSVARHLSAVRKTSENDGNDSGREKEQREPERTC